MKIGCALVPIWIRSGTDLSKSFMLLLKVAYYFCNSNATFENRLNLKFKLPGFWLNQQRVSNVVKWVWVVTCYPSALGIAKEGRPVSIEPGASAVFPVQALVASSTIEVRSGWAAPPQKR